MSTVTESDIKELKDLINKRFDELKADGAKMSEQIKNLEIGQAKIEARLEEWKPAINKIPDLAEKVGELKNWRQIAFVAITATIGGLVGWLIRGGNLNP
ncbi:MAG: hypothetical protein AB4426_04915 [Xenococcaceae cyanobacterium]